jgi:hypothetical protein
VDRVHAFLAAETAFELNAFVPNEELKKALGSWEGENDEELAWADIVKALKQRDCRSDTRRVAGRSLRGWYGVRLGSGTFTMSPSSCAVQPRPCTQEEP